jgi:hypothetical protein
VTLSAVRFFFANQKAPMARAPLSDVSTFLRTHQTALPCSRYSEMMRGSIFILGKGVV